jgi:hypothetical protein
VAFLVLTLRGVYVALYATVLLIDRRALLDARVAPNRYGDTAGFVTDPDAVDDGPAGWHYPFDRGESSGFRPRGVLRLSIERSPPAFDREESPAFEVGGRQRPFYSASHHSLLDIVTAASTRKSSTHRSVDDEVPHALPIAIYVCPSWFHPEPGYRRPWLGPRTSVSVTFPNAAVPFSLVMS